MKRFNLLFISLFLIMSWVFTNCKKEEKRGTTLEFYGDGFINQNATVDTGALVKFKFITSSEIDTLGCVTCSINDVATIWNAKIPRVCKNSYTGLFSIGFKTVGVYNLTFNVYNANPDSVTNALLLQTRKFEITVDTATFLRQEFTGKLYHVHATIGNGAWDLVTNIGKGTSDAAIEKDMIQSSVDTSGSAWVAGWKINNGGTTKFVKNNTLNYATASVRSAKSAFDAGIALSFVSPVALNDIYIAKLRGLDEYAVIKITKITPTDVTGTTDLSKGSIEFTYKKKP